MNLEKRVKKNTRRIETIEDAVEILSTLTVSRSDQIEKMLFGIDELRALQRETSDKLNALIDAQTRNEDAFQKNDAEFQKHRTEAQKNFSKLAQSITSANHRLDKIEGAKNL